MKSISTGQVDGPGQVGHEHDGALEHADEQRRPAGVVGGDRGAELGDPGLERRPRRRRPRRGRGCRSGALDAVGRHRRTVPRAVECRAPAERSRPRLRRTSRPPPTSQATRLAAGHGEHPLDGGRVGRVALVAGAQPRRARPAGRAARARRRGRGRRWGRAPAASSSSSVGVVAEHVGLPGEHGGDVALGDRVEQRQQLVAHAVAAEARVVVRSGRATGSRPSSAHSACVSARRRRRIGRCCRADSRPSPSSAGAAQQVEQHRLGLVVGGVAGEHVRRAAPRSGPRGPGPRGSGPASTSTRSARNAAPKRAAARRDHVGLGRRARPAARGRRAPR